MKPSFALNLSTEGIGLFHRSGDGWQEVGKVSLEHPDLARELEFLRRTAAGLEPGGITTKLIIPNSQILYRTIEVDSEDRQTRAEAVREAMDGATPYALDQLAIDWRPAGKGRIAIAACARETLREAETFAEDNRFNPVSLVACPESSDVFPGEPFFGETRAAATLLEPGARVQREVVPVPVGARPAESPDNATTTPQPAEPPRDAAFGEAAPAIPAPGPTPRRRRLSFLQQAEAMPARSQIILGLLLIALALVLWVSVVMRETLASWVRPEDAAPAAATQIAAAPPDTPLVGEEIVTGDPSGGGEDARAVTPGARPPPGMLAHPADPIPGTRLEAHKPDAAAKHAQAPVEMVIARGMSSTALRATPSEAIRALGPAPARADPVAHAISAVAFAGRDARTVPVVAVAHVSGRAGRMTLAGLSQPGIAGSPRAGTELPDDGSPEILAPRHGADRAGVTAATAESLAPRSGGERVELVAVAPARLAPQGSSGKLVGTDVTPQRSTREDSLAAADAATGMDTGAADAAGSRGRGAAQGISAPSVTPAAPPPLDNGAGEVPSAPNRLAALAPSGPDVPDAAMSSEADVSAGADSPGAGSVVEIRPPLVPGRTDLLDAPQGELVAGIRPPLRPAPAIASASVDAAVSAALGDNAEAAADAEIDPLRPRRRPASVGQQNAVTASTASVAPRVPSTASVAREATDKAAVRVQRVMLLGTIGAASNRSALIKIGQSVEKVQVGDEIDGGTVTVITASSLVYTKFGRRHVLNMP